MSLLGLLTIGRAFGSVRREPAPYRVANDRLPNFGREPAFAGAAAGEAQSQAVALAPTETADTGRRMEVAPELPLKERPPLPTLTAPASAEPGRESPLRVAKPRRRTRGRALVQGELSLEAVRVVRNDLYADDLELIPRSRPVEIANLLHAERPKRNPASAGWRGWLAHWRQWFRWQAG